MPNVLIVEDHEENRNLLKILLEANGYRVTAAGDGLEALSAARRDPPDAVVSDVLMPKMDGFALCRTWMQDPALSPIPFIFYSATYVRPTDEEFGTALGAVRYLIKPLEAEVFLQELRSVLQQWVGHAAPTPAAPLDDATTHALHASALTRKVEDKMAQLEKTNRELRLSEARLRSMAAMTSDFFWESDAEHRLTQRGSADKSSGESVLQRPTQIGERRWEIPSLSPDEAGWQSHQATLDAHQPFRDFEFSRVGADGTERFILVSGDPVFDNSGAFNGYRGVGVDITDRKRSENKLRESEVRYRSLFENMLNGFAYCRMEYDDRGHPVDFVYVETNKAFERLTGLKDVVGRRVSELIPGIRELSPELFDIYGRVASTGIPQEFEFDFKSFDKWLKISVYSPGTGYFVAVFNDITERRRNEEASMRFAAAMNAIADAIYLVDRATMRFVHVNDAACRMRKQTREEMLTLGPEGVLETTRAQLERIYDDVIAGGAATEPLELLRTRKDGAQVCVELRRHAIRFEDGWTIITIVRDITEQKKTNVGLKLFRHLVDGSNDAIEVIDPETFRFLDVNQKDCLELGYSREEMLSKTVSDIDIKFDRSRATGFMRSLRKTDSMILESVHRRKDGSEFPVEVSVAYIQLDRDYMVATVRDITERKRSEEALRAAAEQFRGLVEQSIAGIYIIQDGKFAYVNPRYAEIFGYDSADELIGRDALSMVAEKDRAAVADVMQRPIEGNRPSVNFSFTAIRKDGALTEVGVHGGRATYIGRPAVIGLMQDISEKKRAEEQIQRYVKDLEIAFMSTVEVATTLGEMRDPYTSGHQRRVAEIAVAIGAELGFDARRQEGLRVAGYLHDIGKITIPAEILAKPAKLSPIEYELIQAHAQASYDVLKKVKFPWPVAEIALQHHERMDGSGYPQGLKGDAILTEARIMAVADVVEAMSSHRPYRPGLGIEKALAEIERRRNTAYDADVVDACLRLIREKNYQLPE